MKADFCPEFVLENQKLENVGIQFYNKDNFNVLGLVSIEKTINFDTSDIMEKNVS